MASDTYIAATGWGMTDNRPGGFRDDMGMKDDRGISRVV
jgi:hypothetical protein